MKHKMQIACLMVIAMILSGCTPLSNALPSAVPAETTYGNLQGSFQLKKVAPVLLKYEDVDLSTTQAAKIAKKIDSFSKELKLSAAAEGENLLVSPFSVYMTLAVLVTGAEGATYEQLKTLLYPAGMNDEEFQKACGDLICILCRKPKNDKTNPQHGVNPNDTLRVEIASLVCGDRDMPVSEEFAGRAKNYYNANVAVADFTDPAATEAVNKWAKLATNGLIEQLFREPIDPDTVLLLANSLYFEGKWKWEFEKADTKEDVFKGVSSETTVPFMEHDGLQSYTETPLFQATRQYYYGGAYMEIFLPKEGNTVGQVLEEVSGKTVDFGEARGLLKLPKFSIDDEIPLKAILKKMGLENMFKGGITKVADDGRELYCSDAFQKSRIEVDEAGTKAAAVTVMTFAESAFIQPDNGYFSMILNRPFVYRICVDVGQSQQTLFVAIVNNL